MTLEELITDLKAAGANENTLRLAMNCYELGQKEEREDCATHYKFFTRIVIDYAVHGEREACAKLCEQSDRHRGDYFAAKIRERGQHARH